MKRSISRPGFFSTLKPLLVGVLATGCLLAEISAVRAQTTAEVAAFFSWAESAFPTVFPSGPATQELSPYLYRAYSGGHYLGLANGRVYLLGPITQQKLKDFGPLTEYACLIDPGQTGCGSSSGNAWPWKLTDTGTPADRCYKSTYALTDAWTSCTSSEASALSTTQDGMRGRDVSSPDATDGKLGFSYRQAGQYPLTDCIEDAVTGLYWEGKTTDGGLRDASRFFTNYSSTGEAQIWTGTEYRAPTTEEIAFESNAAALVAFANGQRLCGFDDWRLPSVSELLSLANYGASPGDTAVDADWLPGTDGQHYWTSTASVSQGQAWAVNFYEGGTSASVPRSNSNLRARLVRGSPISSASYQAQGDGSEVLDNRTGLIWKRCVEGMSWNGGTCTGSPTRVSVESALQLASESGGWRVPNIKELQSLVDPARTGPALDPTFIGATTTPDTFEQTVTSTPFLGGYGTSDYVWVVDFLTGRVIYGLTDSRVPGYDGSVTGGYFLRLVR